MKRGLIGILAAVLVAATPACAQADLFGFSDNTTLRKQFTPEQDADLLARAGSSSMRILVHWKWVEKRPGTLDLSMYDPIYEAMLARGIRPLFNLMGSPKWAWTRWTLCFPEAECHVPPDRSHDGAWSRFVAAVARRFPQAAGIEVWNEPNLRLFFHPAPNPKRYTELLWLARNAVKGVDPAMPVLGGALAGVMGAGSPQAMSLRSFLGQMYANGARGLMDGLSVHPYVGRYTYGYGRVFDVLDATIETRDSARDTAPVWITETGISTSGQTSEASQAAILGHLAPMLLRRPGVRGVYLHTLADLPQLTFTIEDGFGIVRRDGAPKPAFCTLSGECDGPVAGPRTGERWRAQELLQREAETALAWRRQTGGYSGFLSDSLPPDPDALPGPEADPARIAVLAVARRADALRLCNTSTDNRSYCITLVPGGPWAFTTTTGSITETAAATDAGRAQSW